MENVDINLIAIDELWKSHSDGHIPVMLEIYNPDLKWNDNSEEQENMYLRVIDDSNPVIYQSKKYLPCKFEFTPPEEDGKKIGQASITISALDSRIVQMLRSIEVPSEVKVVAMFAKKGTVYKFYPLEQMIAKIAGASYNKTTAQFQLVYKDVLNLNVPRDIATKDILPSVSENG